MPPSPPHTAVRNTPMEVVAIVGMQPVPIYPLETEVILGWGVAQQNPPPPRKVSPMEGPSGISSTPYWYPYRKGGIYYGLLLFLPPMDTYVSPLPLFFHITLVPSIPPSVH